VSTVKTKRHERNPGPYPAERECKGCGAKPLSRYHAGDYCAPCQGGEWHNPDELDERRRMKLARGRLEGLAA